MFMFHLVTKALETPSFRVPRKIVGRSVEVWPCRERLFSMRFVKWISRTSCQFTIQNVHSLSNRRRSLSNSSSAGTLDLDFSS